MHLKCFRVRVQSRGPVADLGCPWLPPEPAPVLTDEFDLQQAAVECARLASANGSTVLSCERVIDHDGDEFAEAIEWEPSRTHVGELARAA